MDKKHLLNESKVFCMLPWLHLNVTPLGNVYPCCSSAYTDPIDNVKNKSMEEIFNSDDMKQLRLDMIAGKENSKCQYCYSHEAVSPHSFRTYANEQLHQHFDDFVPTMHEDGTMPNFKMKYFDIRFSNICNMKCRTCGGEFSSQWAKEMVDYEKEHLPHDYKIIAKADDSNRLLDDCINQIENMELVYFAGGEPLITDEHYILLEEMIRKGANKNITLRYNTNMSNFKYKKYDILDLWSKFKKVEISASIDHYGERAEYIRHGTDWGVIENNIKLIRNLPNLEYQMNTVLSVFNYVTLADFMQYLIDKDLIFKTQHISIYKALSPSYFTAKILPEPLKTIGTEKNKKLHAYLEENLWHVRHEFFNCIEFANDEDAWQSQKKDFLHQIKRRDNIRQEDFEKTFPELGFMLNG